MFNLSWALHAPGGCGLTAIVLALFCSASGPAPPAGVAHVPCAPTSSCEQKDVPIDRTSVRTTPPSLRASTPSPCDQALRQEHPIPRGADARSTAFGASPLPMGGSPSAYSPSWS